MIQKSLYFQFSECSLTENLVLESFFNLFDGNDVVGFILNGSVLGCNNDAIRT